VDHEAGLVLTPSRPSPSAPLGNSYQINNLTDVDAVLVFMQARELAAIVEPDEAA